MSTLTGIVPSGRLSLAEALPQAPHDKVDGPTAPRQVTSGHKKTCGGHRSARRRISLTDLVSGQRFHPKDDREISLPWQQGAC
jgi:hypothetical protein